MVVSTEDQTLAGIAHDRDDIEDAIRSGLQARETILEEYTTPEIVELLAAAARAWCAPHYARRKTVVRSLCDTLRMHPAMLEQGMDAIFGVITEEALNRWIEQEVGEPERLGAPARDPRGRLLGPRVIFHALAGNIPGLAIPQICAAALARSVCVLRESRRQPLLTSAFLDTLAELSPELASLIVPAAWAPNDTLTEKFVFDWSDHIEVTGSDDVIKTIASRHARRRIVAHGNRLSIAVVPRDADPQQWVNGLARDIVLYDGMGCLTPQLILIEGDDTACEKWEHPLGIALERLSVLWPREPRMPAQENARRAFLSDAEVAAACDPECGLVLGRDDAWAIRIDARARWVCGPGSRIVTMVPIADLDEALDLIHDSETPLAGVALADDPNSESFAAFGSEVQEAGASLVCPVGELQRPGLAWQPDGAERLGGIVAWRVEET
ncbi:MAG: acyl-CoA reductase-like NAD-dependent aldehyde dehydrogenase [Hyphomicrobiaceae bacterium]|jgi:acyl-CoA reductase-like NAD-dependent aldehyde dehydrogenase